MPIQLFCQHCGGEFFRFPANIKEGRDKYCSRKCKDEAQTGVIKEETVRVSVSCQTCEKEFLAYPSVIERGGGKYCSNHCARTYRTDEERLQSFVIYGKKKEGCWDWSGFKDKDGYAIFTVNRQHTRAARFSYEIHHGPIPEGLQVLHTCDNPACINPLHLWVGTQKDNMIDRLRKDRHPSTTLTEADVLAIRALKGTMPPKEIAARFHVEVLVIHNILAGRTWKYLLGEGD